jgi:hypothetical protein
MTSTVASVGSVRTSGRELFVQVVVACIGCALAAVAFAANQQWLDRHFLPAFFISRAQYVRTETTVRIVVAVMGLLLAIPLRRWIARAIAKDFVRVISIALAIALSFGTAEVLLRRSRLRAAEEVPARKEPRRHLDARMGWLFVPSHVGYQSNNGRRVQYAFDANGYRVERTEAPVDFTRPTIVFTGESIMVGEKLHWRETIPAQTAAMLNVNVQSANIAVSGFASDQAYLRLTTELPRFRNPVAVVTLFTPGIFDRNLDDDRPHLGAGMQWMPPADRWRLLVLARRIIRYRGDASIERGIEITQEILRNTVTLARARGAVPLIVVPQFAPEEPRERELRKRILDDAGLPYVRVELDPAYRVWDDGHPDARGAHVIAAAVADRLRMELGTDSARFATHARPLDSLRIHHPDRGRLQPLAGAGAVAAAGRLD